MKSWADHVIDADSSKVLFEGNFCQTVTANHVPFVWPRHLHSFVTELDVKLKRVASSNFIHDSHAKYDECSQPCYEKRQFTGKGRYLKTGSDYDLEMYRMMLYLNELQHDNWKTECMRCANAILDRLIISINQESVRQIESKQMSRLLGHDHFVDILKWVYVCLYVLRTAAKKKGIALNTCDILVRKV